MENSYIGKISGENEIGTFFTAAADQLILINSFYSKRRLLSPTVGEFLPSVPSYLTENQKKIKATKEYINHGSRLINLFIPSKSAFKDLQ